EKSTVIWSWWHDHITGDPSAHRERGKNNRTKPTILSRFFSKNESLLAIRFNSFIKIPAPEILPS
ncbi:hypothetical protein P0240_15050, partial [Enterobacter cloacae]|nr:hypothetical protein [Enterobacter cloacae]